MQPVTVVYWFCLLAMQMRSSVMSLTLAWRFRECICESAPCPQELYVIEHFRDCEINTHDASAGEAVACEGKMSTAVKAGPWGDFPVVLWQPLSSAPGAADGRWLIVGMDVHITTPTLPVTPDTTLPPTPFASPLGGT